MDGVDGDDSALAQRGEGGEHHVSAGSERDGAVHRYRRLVERVTHPDRAHLARQRAMRPAPGGDVGFAAPGPQDLNRQMRGGPEAKDADALAALHARDAQGAVADDSGAEQGSEFFRLGFSGQGNQEVRAGGGVLGVSAMDGIAGKYRMVAEVFPAPAAE